MSLIGDTKLSILRALSDSPSYGYDLHKKLGVTTSTIYQHLNELEDAGMVEASPIEDDSRDKTMYQLTRRGEQLLGLLADEE